MKFEIIMPYRPYCHGDLSSPGGELIQLENGSWRNEIGKIFEEGNELEARGIETRPLFACVPNQQPAYSFLKGQWDLPNADWLGKNGLHIGCHQYLTQEDLDKIVKAFEEILERDYL